MTHPLSLDTLPPEKVGVLVAVRKGGEEWLLGRMPYVVRDKIRPRMQRETRGAELARPGGVREGFLQKVTPE